MLKRTALDRFRATPFPPLQTLGDNPAFTGAPGPEFLPEEPDELGYREPDSPEATFLIIDPNYMVLYRQADDLSLRPLDIEPWERK